MQLGAGAAVLVGLAGLAYWITNRGSGAAGHGTNVGEGRAGGDKRGGDKTTVPQPPIHVETTEVKFVADSRGVIPSQTIVVTGPSVIPDPVPSEKWLGFKRNDVRPGTAEFILQVKNKGLAPGTKARLTFSSEAIVNVAIGNPALAEIEVSPAVLNFPNPATGMQAQTISVSGSSQIDAPMGAPNWLNIRPDTAHSRLSVGVNQLPPGEARTAYLVFGGSKQVKVNVSVPRLIVEPPSLAFPAAGSGMQPQKLTVTGYWVPKPQSGVSWLSYDGPRCPAGTLLKPVQCELTVSVLPAGAPAGKPVSADLTFPPDPKVRVTLIVPDSPIEIQPPVLPAFTWTRDNPPAAAKNFVVLGAQDLLDPKVRSWLTLNRVSSAPGRTEYSLHIVPEVISADPFKDSYTEELEFPQGKKLHVQLNIKDLPGRFSATGTAHWEGSLGANEELVSKGKLIRNLNGVWQSSNLTREDMHVTVQPSSPNVKVIQQPAESNNFTLILRNNTGGTITSIDITWDRK
jgi:hypothetical protein